MPPPPGGTVDFDVLLLGGGLSLLYAPLLAARGLRVAVVEQHRAGQAHREWNASWAELQALVQDGLLDQAALEGLLLARYQHGVCRWHGGGEQQVRGVLDCAVDAAALLQLARQRAEAQGVTFFDACRCLAVGANDSGVRVLCRRDAGELCLRARLVLDGRGAQSPYGQTDLICPTVGGVMEGLRFDPRVGDILATTQHVEDGRQYIWEGFPGRAGQIAIYLFYYAPRRSVGPGALQALYERFFATLSQFKSGRGELVRPTFGLIPGWSRLCRGPAAPHQRIVLVGDAAARHSPLTFCGFGATLRSLQPVSQGIAAFVASDRLGGRPVLPASLVDDRPLHTATGALARVMAQPPPNDPAALNTLLNVAFGTLEEMGNEAFAALLQDRMALGQFTEFLQQTSKRFPQVYPLVWRSLGSAALLRWSAAVGTSWLRHRVRWRAA
ncbi:MAG: lycopene cyclase [Deltaproteobacteria bacterium]|nr:MAG: lycopene cyclase [Deltaproteobacteria bacterium]